MDVGKDPRPLTRAEFRVISHEWHVALNQYDAPFSSDSGTSTDASGDAKGFMYDAKHLADELPRMILVFGMERRAELAKVHHQCSRDAEGEPVRDNHLTCCLGIECRACPHLAVIDRVATRRDYTVRPSVEVPVTGEERDAMKAYTCAAHILSSGGDPANEGWLVTVDDRMYWDNVHRSLATGGAVDE